MKEKKGVTPLTKKKFLDRSLPAPVIVPAVPERPPTFAFPSHALMYTLLAMFAGRPEQIPKQILDKPYSERTPEEKERADIFLDSILRSESKTTFSEDGEEITKERQLALVSDSPRVEAEAEIPDTLFSEDPEFREGSLAVYIKRTFGPEGLRHLLGLIIGLEENFRQGFFPFNINEHLQRLGYQERRDGGFAPDLKRTATGIVKVFTSLILTARDRVQNIEKISTRKLFSIDGLDLEKDVFANTIINETIILRATDFWYKHAFEERRGSSKKYTKLLKKIAGENHREHPLTLYLAPLFAIWWRIGLKPYRLAVGSLLKWCDLDMGRYLSRSIKELESELNYMKEQEYLGDWQHDGDSVLLSDCRHPLDRVLVLPFPAWLEPELLAIEERRDSFLTAPTTRDPIITKDEFIRLLQNTGMTQKQFGNNLGITRQMVSMICNGNRPISQTVSDKVREVFGHMLPI